MTSPIQVKTQAISQDTFPGAFIEPKWSRMSIIQSSAPYAVRYLLGAKVIYSPMGRTDFVQLNFEGMVYCLHVDNFRVVKELAAQLAKKWQADGFYEGYQSRERLRQQPNLIIDGLQYLNNVAVQLYDIPLEKTRMIWMVPDMGACGYYRSKVPQQYQQATCGEFIYTESSEFANYSTISWFDVFTLHRVPPVHVLGIFQNLKASGKTIVYEFDDDIFNIPDWNPNSSRYDANALQRARVSINLADLIICSTEPLRQVSGKPDIAMVGPNLINISSGNFEPLKCNRELVDSTVGYKREEIEGDALFVHPHKPPLAKFESLVEPVRILWTGSSTHDQDLEEVLPAIRHITEKYGIAVTFIFFGYCPAEFLETIMMPGNTNPKFVVKPEYKFRIHYVEPRPFDQYIPTIRELDPDFAICPLSAHPFNISKSPLKILELGALGIPVIASNYGPYSEFIQQIPVINIGSTDRWIYWIEKFIKNVPVRQVGGTAIHDYVLNNYTWQINSPNRQKWDAIFQRIHTLAQEKRKDIYERIELQHGADGS